MGVRKDTGMRGFNFNAPIADAGTSRHSFAGIQQSERGDAKNDNGRGGDKPERYEIEERAQGSPPFFVSAGHGQV